MPKKKWKKPRLTVLSKGKPEEAVIQVCKYDGSPVGAGPENLHCADFLNNGTCKVPRSS